MRGQNVSQDTRDAIAKRDREQRQKWNKGFTYGISPQDWEKQTGNKLLSYQTSDGLLMKGNMRFQTPEQQAQTMYSKPVQPAAAQPVGGQIGQSFGKMMGGGGFSGGMPSMGQLEAASMRLADAAAKRERETKEFEYGLRSKETKKQEFRDEISRLESELRQAESSPVRDNTEQKLKNQKVANLQNAISRAKSQLRQFD